MEHVAGDIDNLADQLDTTRLFLECAYMATLRMEEPQLGAVGPVGALLFECLDRLKDIGGDLRELACPVFSPAGGCH